MTMNNEKGGQDVPVAASKSNDGVTEECEF